MLRITRLNKEVKQNILEQKYSPEQIMAIKGKIEADASAKNKGVILAAIFMVIMEIYLIVALVMDSGITWKNISIALIMIPFFVGTIYLVRFISFGLYIKQFNKAVDKGYAMYGDSLKIEM